MKYRKHDLFSRLKCLCSWAMFNQVQVMKFVYSHFTVDVMSTSHIRASPAKQQILTLKVRGGGGGIMFSQIIINLLSRYTFFDFKNDEVQSYRLLSKMKSRVTGYFQILVKVCKLRYYCLKTCFNITCKLFSFDGFNSIHCVSYVAL